MEHHTAAEPSHNSSLTPTRASNQAPTTNPQAESDSELDPDMPLEHDEETNEIESRNSAEGYVPWRGGKGIGILPRVHGVMCALVGLLPLATGYIAVCILVFLPATDPLGKYMVWIFRFFASLLNMFAGVINWAPVFFTYAYLSNNPSANKTTFGCAVVIGGVCFGLLSWANYALSNAGFDAWYLGSHPQSFKGCDARVTPQQSPLFTPRIYGSQFARVSHVDGNGINWVETFNATLSHSIQQSHTLCSQGFEGNSDLYGLGIRTGIYIQWISSLCANNLLPEDRKELQKVYLIFSLAICIATMVSSFGTACIFGIEIELLYLMYWGGYVCVFASSPCSVRLGSDFKWLGLDWIFFLQFTTHMLMTYHGIWFVW